MKCRLSKASFKIKHVAPKELPLGSRLSATVFEAVKHLWKDAIDDQTSARLQWLLQLLPVKARKELLPDVRHTTE